MGYSAQFRGGNSAYASYFHGMDKSMRQKVALISSYFPTKGMVADMGSGSGSGSYDLACLYPGLHVVGVDISSAAVGYSREKYKRDNLSYKEGDIADKLFGNNELTGILNSSVLHHVTSFNAFDTSHISRLLDNQTQQLSQGGILAIRDFVIPDFGQGNQNVIIELDANDGKNTGNATESSTALLFEKFFQDFQCSAYAKGKGKYTKLPSEKSGKARFETDLRSATEFILRKDYRADWDVEILEEYLYYTKAQFESEFRKRGLRIVISRELRNPWIISNRFEGKIQLFDTSGNALPFPPTNYLIVGEKTSGSVAFSFMDIRQEPKSSFLSQETYYDGSQIWDMVSRKNLTYDLIPYYFRDNRLNVVSRQGYPRPLAALNESPDGAAVSGYIHEPIIINHSDGGSDLSNEKLIQLFSERSELAPDSVKKIIHGLQYYPSPGGINEKVSAILFEISPANNFLFNSGYEQGFFSSGEIRSLDAAQFLRAGQVGGICDNRIEINIYDLIFTENISLEPWIGAEFEENAIPDKYFHRAKELSTSFFAAGEKTFTISFRKIVKDHEFLTTESALIEENDKDGNILGAQRYEYVKPATLSLRTISVIPYFTHNEDLYIGVELRHLPAPYISEGFSEIYTSPAFRIPHENAIAGRQENFVLERMQKEFATKITGMYPIGGAYYPSPGITPEAVAVYAGKIDAKSMEKSSLYFIKANDLIKNRNYFRDAHLLVGVFRLRHAYETYRHE